MSRSEEVNGNTYTEPDDFDQYGYRTKFFDLVSDVVTVASNADTAQTAAETAQAAAETAQTNAETAQTNAETAQSASEAARDLAQTYRDQAQAAASAAEKGIAFTTTAGSGSAYTADFNPDVTVGDGSMFSLDIHTANTVTNPTLAVEGGTAYTMVNENGNPIAIGAIAVGRNLLVTFDSENNQYRILEGLPFDEIVTPVNANGNAINNQRAYDWCIREQGSLTQEDDKHVITFRVASRLHNIDASLTAGTVTVDLKKNGVSIGGLGAVAVTTAQTETAVNDSGNAYIDFAAGDKLSIDKESVSAAENLEVWMDIEERI